MAFAGLDAGDDQEPPGRNQHGAAHRRHVVLPLIFMVTAPLLTHAVQVDLPRATSAPNLTKPDNVQVAIDGRSRVYWNGEAVDHATLAERMAGAAALQPQPEIHLRAERTTPYETVAQVAAAAARQG